MAVTALNKRVTVAAVIAAASGLLGACSGHVEVQTSTAAATPTSESPAATPGVSKEKLAAVVKQRAEAKVGARADSVVCDGDLPARVGAEQQCVLTDGADQYRVHVTASNVNGGNVNFHFEIDPDPINSTEPASPGQVG